MNKYLLRLVILIIGISLSSCNFFSTKGVNFPENYEAQPDITYKSVDGWDGRIDLYFNPKAVSPTPVVLNIHGGGWNHGTKESQTGFGSFFDNGYAVANVEYRLAGEAPAPAAIEDIRCALSFLGKNAEQFNLDTAKIVLMGASAGGHLALMAGLTSNDKLFSGDCESKNNTHIFAIIDKYGPTDLLPAINNGSVKRWLGDKISNIDFVKSISPVYYVNEFSPPVFIVHGTDDPLVPYEQSVLLYNKLKENYVKAELFTVEGGEHGKFSKESNLEIKNKMWQFLTTIK